MTTTTTTSLMNILLVEDNPGDVLLIKEVLDESAQVEYHLECAYQLSTGLERLIKGGIDLILLDLGLPDSNGLDTFGKFRAQVSSVPIVVLTGLDDEVTALQAVRQGAQDYLPKGDIDSRVLWRVMRYAVERKQAEAKLIEYQESDRFRKNLLALVSHELRTPLALSQGYSTMLLEHGSRLTRHEKRTYLRAVDTAIDSSIDLVDNLLDMSRMEAGLLELEKHPTNISRLIKKAVADTKTKDINHDVVANLTQRLPSVNIDAKRIHQVLNNLIDNAIRYSAYGTEVLIEARLVGPEVQVSVADQGEGVSAEDLARVFDLMYRIEHRLTPDMGGIGLGLPICRGLVEAHGGRIWLESKIGKGSTFHFTIPIKGGENCDKSEDWASYRDFTG